MLSLPRAPGQFLVRKQIPQATGMAKQKKKGVTSPKQVQNPKVHWGRDLHFGPTGVATPQLLWVGILCLWLWKWNLTLKLFTSLGVWEQSHPNSSGLCHHRALCCTLKWFSDGVAHQRPRSTRFFGIWVGKAATPLKELPPWPASTSRAAAGLLMPELGIRSRNVKGQTVAEASPLELICPYMPFQFGTVMAMPLYSFYCLGQ